MKFIGLLIVLANLFSISAGAQENTAITTPAKRQYFDLGIGFGNSQTSISGSYLHNWHVGKKRKIFLGVGGRINSQFGNDVYFTSAPASLASEEKNVDSLFISSPSVFAVNAVINLGYRFSEKFQVGFNIDAIGFSVGAEKAASFIRNGGNSPALAKPTSFNLLLIGNNDQGSLNSQFYLQYDFKPNLGVKAAYQYFFTEFTTNTNVQQTPEPNDRFRNKASMGYIGVVYGF